MLSHSASPIPDKMCANQCCTSTFASFFSPQMSSCGYWKTPRADVQTTTRGHPDLIDGKSVRPMKRLAASAGAVLVPSGMPRTCQRRKRRKSADPITPLSNRITTFEIENRILSVLRTERREICIFAAVDDLQAQKISIEPHGGRRTSHLKGNGGNLFNGHMCLHYRAMCRLHGSAVQS